MKFYVYKFKLYKKIISSSSKNFNIFGDNYVFVLLYNKKGHYSKKYTG
jgi:hypothetical protein